MRGERFRKTIRYLPAPAAFVMLLLKAGPASAAAREGLDICWRSVLPSLFPALVLSNLLIGVGLPDFVLSAAGAIFERLFCIRRTALPVLLCGLVGGYPLGASAAAECCRLGGCTEEEAGRLTVFANNCSPAFLFGLLGSGSDEGRRQALLLLLIQWLVSLWLGIFLGIGYGPSTPEPSTVPTKSPSFFAVFTSAVRNGGRSVLMICAYVVFFSVLTAFLPCIPVLRGFFELTGGLVLAQAEGGNALIAEAFLIGWGGLSVACQVYSALDGSGIPTGSYLLLRLLHGLLMSLCILAYLKRKALLLPVAAVLAFAVFVKKCRNMRHAVI